jgi:hypothetical protein
MIKDGGRKRAVKVVVTALNPNNINLEALAQDAWSEPLRMLTRGDISIKVETFDPDEQAYWDRRVLRLRRAQWKMRMQVAGMLVISSLALAGLVAFNAAKLGMPFPQTFFAIMGFFLLPLSGLWMRLASNWGWRDLKPVQVIISHTAIYVVAAMAYAYATANAGALNIRAGFLLFSLPFLLVLLFDWLVFHIERLNREEAGG